MPLQLVRLLNSPVNINIPLNPRGEYDADTEYITGDSVSYQGSSFVALTTTTGNLPTDTDFWQLLAEKGEEGEQGIQGEPGANGTNGTNGTNGQDGLDINWLGDYDNATEYVINDAVSYDGSSYICTATTTGNLPTDTDFWDLMAQKGADGTGASSISELTDVDLTGLSNGNVLAYDSTETLWKPVTPSGGGGGGMSTLFDLASSHNFEYRRVIVDFSAVSPGNIDAYTCPSGKIAVCAQFSYTNNSGGTTPNYATFTEASGSPIHIGGSANTANGVTRTFAAGNFAVLAPGDKLGANITGVTFVTGSYTFYVQEFDFDSNWKRPHITGLTTTAQTLYTCPTGKVAIIPSTATMGFNTFYNANLFNGNSDTVTAYEIQTIPSGDSPNSKFITGSGNMTATNGGARTTQLGYLKAGDYINVSVAADRANSFFNILVYEMDA